MSLDFQRLEQILAEAVENKDPAERAAFLDRACGADRELRAEVERLLKANEQAGNFLEANGGTLADAGLELIGARIGRYKLLEQIGEGAFGVVYMAEQVEPVRRQVALKIVKAGMDTREVIARFEAERQALALMDHPNIARVFDGGVVSASDSQLPALNPPPPTLVPRPSVLPLGRPYFVMELVRGIPITEFCDQRKLSTSERLRLFIQVCHAVQHAHQKGIIHRDLKPSNILVTLIDGEPVPKVIDFGVAKALDGQKLTEKTLFTGFLKMVGTPAYMSPEQADLSGVDIDTRSDVYTLGVLLYELLTGVTPFDAEALHNAGLDEIRRMIRETEPPKPSTRLRALGDKLTTVAEQRQAEPTALNRLVRGDLDWIVMKCLEKDRGRRYEAAHNLAADIDRHLKQEPVTAAAPSTLYRARKFIGRHKAAIVMATASVLLLTGAAIVSAWQAQQARRARDLAQGRLYASQMKLAHAAIREGKMGGALALLVAQQPAPGAVDFRGFDWRYLYRRCCNSLSEVVATNASGFQSVDFSPDGRALAFGSSDGWVELFDLETRRQMKHWRAHSGAIDRLAFYPSNPQWLATASGADHAFRLWDIASEKVFFNTPTAGGMQVNFAFSPGGHFLVTQATNAQSLWLWEFGSGSVASRGALAIKENLDSCGPVAFSPDERLLALCNHIQGGVFWTTCLYGLADGTRTNLPLVHSDIIFAVAFSPDGSKLATAGVDERLAIWDVKRRTYLWHGRSDLIFATSLAFSRDGRTLYASGYSQNIRSWNVSHPAEVQTWTGHSAGVNQLAIAPDGSAFASAGEDGTGRLWHPNTREPLSAASPGEAFTAVLASQGPGLEGEQESVWAVAVSPDQNHAAVAKPRHLFLCDLRTGTYRTNVPLASLFPDATPVPVSLTYSPDGARLAVGTDDGRVILFDALTLCPLQAPLRLHKNQISHIAFALNGSLLATGGGFGTGVKLTDPASGRVHAEFAANEGFFPMQPLAVFPDGKRLATGSPEGWVRIWDVASRRLLASSPGRVGLVTDLAFSPDGKWLAISDARKSIFLWGLETKQRWRRLVGHTGVAIKLAFSPDARTLASGGMDHTIRLWHPDIDREVAILTGHTEWIEALGFVSGGNALLSGSRDGTLLLWRALPFEQNRALDPPDAATRRE